MKKCIICGKRTTELVYLFAGSPAVCLECFEAGRAEAWNHEEYKRKERKPRIRVIGWGE
jgi:hypothetical protein